MWRPTRRQSWMMRLLVLLGLVVTDRGFHLWPARGATITYLIVLGLLIIQAWSELADRGSVGNEKHRGVQGEWGPRDSKEGRF